MQAQNSVVLEPSENNIEAELVSVRYAYFFYSTYQVVLEIKEGGGEPE